MFKHARKPSKEENEGHKEKQDTTPAAEQSEGTTSKSNSELGSRGSSFLPFVYSDDEQAEEKSPPHPTSIFVTTINPDSSITEEKKPITPATPNLKEETCAEKDESLAEESVKFVPLEKKRDYTFNILITSQGQEVLKSKDFLDKPRTDWSSRRRSFFASRIENWSFFAGSLQQRLNLVVTNVRWIPKALRSFIELDDECVVAFLSNETRTTEAPS